MENEQLAISAYRVTAVVIYLIVLLCLCLMFGFWQGLGIFGILILFGWAMNLENRALKLKEQ